MATRRTSTSLFDKIMHLLNIALVLAYLSMYISPEKYWQFAFLGLAYFYILIVNICFIVFWLIRNPKKIAISLLIIIIGFGNIGKHIQFSSKALPKDATGFIKVMSYNVKLFDLYNYNKNWTYNYTGRNEIFQYLRQETPDIIAFQEYFYDSKNNFTTRDSLKKILNTNYYHEYFPCIIKNHYYGIATFSKHPIIHKGEVVFSNDTHNSAIFSDIKIKEDTIRVYNVHLQSIKLNKEDFLFSATQNKIKDNVESLSNEFAKDSRKILSKLKIAFINRARQAEMVRDHMKNSPFPIIVCGDFNDSPCSYATHVISKKLKDAFVVSGKGFGKTYNGKMPSFRIDYILHDKSYMSCGFKTDYSILSSDHFPIYTYLKKKK